MDYAATVRNTYVCLFFLVITYCRVKEVMHIEVIRMKISMECYFWVSRYLVLCK